MTDLSDTICALATGSGHSGLGVVRVSGSRSFEIYQHIFRSIQSIEIPKPRVSMLGRIVDPRNGEEIDEAVAVSYFAPKSYTGEDMTEYSIHGSPVLIAALLECICNLGARLAQPGEFTMRAFLNGKMDLIQAEAVRDIIDSTTLFQARISARQRSGEISAGIQPIKKLLTEIVVQLESAVEFVEEDLTLDSRSILLQKINAAGKDIRKWIESFRLGRIVRDGFSMAVIGRPNVGKSSLFNALLKQDRSIVMDLPGTTRDMISEYTSIGGIPVRLLDTAGIHQSLDNTEMLGIERTRRAISDADAILFVIDGSQPPSKEEMDMKSELQQLHSIIVMNKCDLALQWTKVEMNAIAEKNHIIEVSAKFGDGIELLRSIIIKSIFGDSDMKQDSLIITNLRQCQYLESMEKELFAAEKALNDGLSEEFVLIHLHKAMNHMGAITGETTVEDLLTEIFSRFCIGK